MTESTMDADVRSFFATFEAANAAADTEALAGCFAGTFLAGDTGGAIPVPRAAFLEALPGRIAHARAQGLGPATLASLDLDRLDESWVLARTRWLAPRADREPFAMVSTFLLHREGGGWRIAVYLNHEGLGLRTGRVEQEGRPPVRAAEEPA